MHAQVFLCALDSHLVGSLVQLLSEPLRKIRILTGPCLTISLFLLGNLASAIRAFNKNEINKKSFILYCFIHIYDASL